MSTALSVNQDARLVVKDVYGDIHHVSARDYHSGRQQLRLYTATGMRLADYYEHMRWRGRSTTLHRDNIAEVLSEATPGCGARSLRGQHDRTT